jgi:GDPmannose 4,6-dehydratase
MNSKPNEVLITGITGQDGSYLADLFLDRGFVVHGQVRRSSTFNTKRIDHILTNPETKDRLKLHYGDITDYQSTVNLVSKIRPVAVYNMAAQSHVKISFEMPNYTFACNSSGVLNILEAIRVHSPESFLYQASTSELFGNSPAPQSESTSQKPESPYAVSKMSAHELVRLWKEAYGLNALSGILFNHESFRRGENFVTKKIVINAHRIYQDLKNGISQRDIPKLELGNLRAIRDWGWAPEYMCAIADLVGNLDTETIVIGTGVSASVDEFAARTFSNFGLIHSEWISMSSVYVRPTDVGNLRANTQSLINRYNWSPVIKWESLCDLMCEEELSGKEKTINWNDLGPMSRVN